MKEIVFVTHNKGKAKSAEKYFKGLKISTYEYELSEPRSDSIKGIATAKVKRSLSSCQKALHSSRFWFLYRRTKWFSQSFCQLHSRYHWNRWNTRINEK